MVPVIDEKGNRLFPTKERRARKLMERGEAVPYHQKGFFCIKLLRTESEKREAYPEIAIGVDPGSKREGYTLMTLKSVIFNITSDTSYWVKSKLKTRSDLRRSRRQRKTPYRKMRANRAASKRKGRLPPSTKARWDNKLRILKLLFRILPITKIIVEDICAPTKKGKRKWNLSFSPLQVGKKYFDKQLHLLFPATEILFRAGKETSNHRKARGFTKTKDKLSYVWEAHNSDSHSLAEMALGTEVRPFKGMYQINFLELHRRQLHVQNPAKGGIRKSYGTTISAGMSRGAVLRDKKTEELCYLGGESKRGITILDIKTKKRITQGRRIGEVKFMYNSKWRLQFLPSHPRMEGVCAVEDK